MAKTERRRPIPMPHHPNKQPFQGEILAPNPGLSSSRRPHTVRVTFINTLRVKFPGNSDHQLPPSFKVLFNGNSHASSNNYQQNRFILKTSGNSGSGNEFDRTLGQQLKDCRRGHQSTRRVCPSSYHSASRGPELEFGRATRGIRRVTSF